MKSLFVFVLVLLGLSLQGCVFFYDRPICKESNLVSLDNVVGKYRMNIPGPDFKIFHIDLDIVKIGRAHYRVISSPMIWGSSEFYMCTIKGQYFAETPVTMTSVTGKVYTGYSAYHIDPLITSNLQFTFAGIDKDKLDALGLKSEILEIKTGGILLTGGPSTTEAPPGLKYLYIHNSGEPENQDRLPILIEPTALKLSLKADDRLTSHR
jgi:hypothetical protein